MPLIYNSSGETIKKAQSDSLYDFRQLYDVVTNPGTERQISTRTIQGFTQYLLSVYQKAHYAGIYVHVPEDAIIDGQRLKNDILPIEVIEVPIKEVKVNFYDMDQNLKEESYLDRDVFEKWSPVKPGEVANKQELDYFINILNLNPDRYVSATVSKGTEPRTLNVEYDVYEVNPWHCFFQIDDAGTKDRKWTPRIGLINTSLLGFNDTLTFMAQAPVHRRPDDNYSIFGSYEFPLWTPRLTLNLFAGRSEFDVDGGGGIDFLGNGYFYGGQFKYNIYQTGRWFLDLKTSLSQEISKNSPSLFPEIFQSKVRMNLWGQGIDLHREADYSDTYISVDRLQSAGGSGQSSFWDSSTDTGARRDADRDFNIWTLSAYHSQYIDPNKIHHFVGSFKYIRPDDRLVPAKMTTFGGLYTVRGYQESGIVADGGVLGSFQYEYDLARNWIRYEDGTPKRIFGRTIERLAPLGFYDYGRAKNKDHVAGEKGAQDLHSVGLGLIMELGRHFNVAFYYGVPLKATTTTDRGDGRCNFNIMLRW
jgi:hemolysin activation/secretion protein